VRRSLDALDAATASLEGLVRLRHIRRVAWIKAAYGQVTAAFDLLERALADLPPAEADEEPEARAEVRSALLYELSKQCTTRGDLDRALALLQESAEIDEQLGGRQGRAASLSQMANVYMQREEWDKAEELLLEALALVRSIGEPPAFELVKLGQVAQARGDAATALARYREGLAIFERLGMPEAQQVRGLIARLQGGAPATGPAAAASAQARAAAQAGRAEEAVALQARAVAELRRAVAQAGEPREGLVQLSVLLYNLATYHQGARRFDDAVAALEEVVALDERTDHPDLADDRAALDRARQLAQQWAGMSEAERAQALGAAAASDF
jgi:tetratricopeptide (TPR) repeat protein